MAEQFGLEQAFGDRAAVDRDERGDRLSLARMAVDELCDMLLADTGFAGDQDGVGQTWPDAEWIARCRA